MSKKQKFEDDEQMKINHSTPAIQNEDHVSCAKVTLPKTTLLDLPMELQEHILLETIVSEVRDRKLLRGAWKEAGDRVAERLRNVCPQWDYVLTTDFFRNRLHGILDSFPQVEFGFKVLVNHRFPTCITFTALNDEFYVLRRRTSLHACIDVYARTALQTVKRTIQLPDVTFPLNFVACSVANCLYILHKISSSIEIWRILTDEHDFQISPWIKCSTQKISRISISADGRLILFQGPAPSTIKVFDVDGSLQYQLELANPISRLHNILAKSNGNFVLVKLEGFTEVDRDGKILYEYNEPFACLSHIYCAVDLYDRIVMIDDGGYVRLLDSEYNSVKVTFELCFTSKGYNKHLYRVQYDKKRNEFLAFECARFDGDCASLSLTIFNFTERSIPNDAQNKQN